MCFTYSMRRVWRFEGSSSIAGAATALRTLKKRRPRIAAQPNRIVMAPPRCLFLLRVLLNLLLHVKNRLADQPTCRPVAELLKLLVCDIPMLRPRGHQHVFRVPNPRFGRA